MSKNITKEAIQSFNNREEAGFREIFNEMLHELHVYSGNMTGDWHESEDIVLCSFIKLWKSKAIFNNGSAVSAYMYKLVRNETINYINCEKRKHRINSDDEFDALEIEEPSCHDKYAENIKKLNAFLDLLPNQCQQIMRLHLIGYSTKEISEKLNVSSDTIYTQQHRAIRKLRKHFGV